MGNTVYVETTIPSYLTSRPSRDLIVAAHQEMVREWWDRKRGRFEVFISQFVLDEASVGDPEAVARRLQVLAGLPVLDVTDAGRALAKALLSQIPLPNRAATDALHIAVAATNGMDYLLTLNCAHIANAKYRSRIESLCEDHEVKAPIICTPEELMDA
ncbi:MAG: hypothetical protein FLDDKLPJ_02688 [Phycisphaerae bacterium]|nr:hypothetical protein [Phycisphaerae bacterium]